MNLMMEIQMGGTATPGQQQQAEQLLGDLLTGLGVYTDQTSALHQQLVHLMDEMQDDHTALGKSEAQISDEITNGSEIIKDMQADMGNDFLDTEVSGPCNVTSVSIKETVHLKIEQRAGTHKELLPYVLALKILDKMSTDNAAATQALSSVLEIWQSLQNMLDIVVQDLKKADADQVVPILQKLYIQAAQDAWTQLEVFAKSLDGSQ